MGAYHRDQGRRLRKIVDHLEADTNLHAKHLIQINCTTRMCAAVYRSRATSRQRRQTVESAAAGFDRVTLRRLPADSRKMFRRPLHMATKGAGCKPSAAIRPRV